MSHPFLWVRGGVCRLESSLEKVAPCALNQIFGYQTKYLHALGTAQRSHAGSHALIYANMREQHTLLAGLLTVCVVSTAALLRLVAVIRIFRRQRRGRFATNGHIAGQYRYAADDESRVASSRVLVPSLVFHVLVFLCLVVEVPVYACRWLAANGLQDFVEEGRQLYALHMTSYLLLYLAFSVVVTLWSDVAVFEPNEWTALMNRWGRGDAVHVSCGGSFVLPARRRIEHRPANINCCSVCITKSLRRACSVSATDNLRRFFFTVSSSHMFAALSSGCFCFLLFSHTRSLPKKMRIIYEAQQIRSAADTAVD